MEGTYNLTLCGPGEVFCVSVCGRVLFWARTRLNLPLFRQYIEHRNFPQ